MKLHIVFFHGTDVVGERTWYHSPRIGEKVILDGNKGPIYQVLDVVWGISTPEVLGGGASGSGGGAEEAEPQNERPQRIHVVLTVAWLSPLDSTNS